jgi:hypothetical protein
VADFLLGGLPFAVIPALRNEFLKYPAVYRSQEGIKAVMHGEWRRVCGRAGARGVERDALQGRFGDDRRSAVWVSIGVFAVCAFVTHNYVNLNIGWTLTLQ